MMRPNVNEYPCYEVNLAGDEDKYSYEYMESGETECLEHIFMDEETGQVDAAAVEEMGESLTYYPTSRDVLARVKKARNSQLPEPASSGFGGMDAPGMFGLLLAILMYLQFIASILKDQATVFSKALDAATLAPRLTENSDQTGQYNTEADAAV